MNKLWIAIIAAIVLVLVSVAATLAVIYFSGAGSSNFNDRSVSRRFNIFAGYSLCEAEIKNSIAGRVLTVEGDDRAAKYERSSNTNQLFFVASYLPESGLFGKLSKIEQRLFVRCDVSAETNTVNSISVRAVEDEDFSEVP